MLVCASCVILALVFDVEVNVDLELSAQIQKPNESVGKFILKGVLDELLERCELFRVILVSHVEQFFRSCDSRHVSIFAVRLHAFRWLGDNEHQLLANERTLERS